MATKWYIARLKTADWVRPPKWYALDDARPETNTVHYRRENDGWITVEINGVLWRRMTVEQAKERLTPEINQVGGPALAQDQLQASLRFLHYFRRPVEALANAELIARVRRHLAWLAKAPAPSEARRRFMAEEAQ
jgi:hypothetical protein